MSKKKGVFNARYNEAEFMKQFPPEEIERAASEIRMGWSRFKRIVRSNGKDDDILCKQRDLIMQNPIPEVHG